MEGLYKETYWLARFMFQRGLGLVYLVAFLVAVNQFRPLLGERGLLPVPRFLERASFRDAPSLFHWHYSDRFFGLVAWAGVLLSLVALFGLADRGPLWLSMLVWFVLWALYLSIVNVGQTFYSFGWESLLLEVGFLAIFIGPSRLQAPFIVILLLRWVLFRLEFGAGLIKLRGDPCWRDLTCLYYHYETQPLPNPVSWYAHRLPMLFHKISVLGNHFVQLIVPWGLFAPQPIASIAGILMILSQLWLVLTGNFSWLNYLTIILGLTSLGDSVVQSVLPVAIPAALPRPPLYDAALAVLALVIALLSVNPIRNMISRGQLMNYNFDPFHLVNTYGAFGSITKRRIEVIVEGTQAETITPSAEWKEYEFKGKPGDVCRTPPIVAPYHWRLDWQMWFVPFSPGY